MQSLRFLGGFLTVAVDEGRQLRVLDLPTLIRVKTKAGRPKDRVMLPVLIATLQEREKLGK